MATSVATQICSRAIGPKPISNTIFLNQWFLQTFVYLEIRFTPFKMTYKAERGTNIKSVQKPPFLKYDLINNGQQNFVKSQKYEPGLEKLRARAQSTNILQ